MHSFLATDKLFSAWAMIKEMIEPIRKIIKTLKKMGCRADNHLKNTEKDFLEGGLAA